MLDQNTLAFLSIVISAMGIIGALGGVYLGSKLNSRYMMEADKRKRNTEKIEEVYSLVLQVDIWVGNAIGLMPKARQEVEYRYDPYSLRYDEIKPSLNRITTLVKLYLPQIAEVTQKFIDEFTRLCDPIYHSLYITSKKESDKEEEIADEFRKASHNYAKSYVDLLFALEKLVR
jgi:hypothetical protein